ncbi:TIGR01777 family oxidoreductase [Amycolatopsis sp. cg5]|uniref:TIGR01777 family oxidoreductase n=1 Tax=Amycolatopsis sp. cg5 TaxID=3238802 RepID=UPI003523B451
MRVLIAGASGLLGQALAERLKDKHEVRTLVRRESRDDTEFSWDPPAARIAEGAFDGVDAVVNFCGAPLFPDRWSAARKQVLLDSRVEPTEVLAEAITEHNVPTLLNASAVGFYGDTGETVVDEESPQGKGFLAGLCTAWERAADPDARVVTLRTGLVLAPGGGLLGPLKPLFKLALGGRLGDGRQYMPWIALEDHVSAMVFLLENEELYGPVNVCGPKPVPNAEFTKAFGRVLHRPAPWWVPGIAMKIALGQAAEEMALYGQRALPRVLEEAGFTFRHNEVESALAAAL